MADITDPQVVAFCNNEVRPMADRLYSAYFRAKATLADYNAGDIGTKISNGGSSNFVGDGSAVDGRTRMTGGDVFNLITTLTAYIAFVENGSVSTADRTTVITIPHVNSL